MRDSFPYSLPTTHMSFPFRLDVHHHVSEFPSDWRSQSEPTGETHCFTFYYRGVDFIIVETTPYGSFDLVCKIVERTIDMLMDTDYFDRFIHPPCPPRVFLDTRSMWLVSI